MRRTKDNIYIGFAGEHYVASRFFSEFYEASKLGIDFGFDVLLSNQYRVATEIDPQLTTMAVQVKTKAVTTHDYSDGEEMHGQIRRRATKTFSINQEEFDLIKSSPNGALVCLFYEKTSTAYNVLGLFWLNSMHLNELEVRHVGATDPFLKTNVTDIEIKAELKFTSTVNHLAGFCVDELIAQFGSHSNLTELKTIINNSKIIPNVSAIRESQVSLINDSGTRLELNRSLTVLKEIVNNHPLQLEYDPSEFYHDYDHTLAAIRDRKFTFEFPK